MTTCAEYQTMLDDAIAQRHKIKLGKAAKSFTHGENQQANFDHDIEGYIRMLQAKVDACTGVRPARRFIQTMPTDGNGRFGRR